MRDYHRELYDVMKDIRKLRFSRLLPDMNGFEFDVLINIDICAAKSEIVRVSDIVKSMAAPAPAVSRAMRILEGEGLILRKIDEADRRNMIVEFTEEGRMRLMTGAQAMYEFAESVFTRMGAEKTSAMIDSLREFAEISKVEIEKRK